MKLTLKTCSVATLAAGLLTLPALAQNTGGTGTGSTAETGNTAGATTGSGTGATSATAAGSGMPMEMSPAGTALQTRLSENFDRLFVLKAFQGNLAEVMTGQLALRKSRNAQVRSLAQMLVQEHGAANRELQPMLTAMGIPLPRTLGIMHAATYDALSKLNNERFDQAFMGAQTEAHEATITLFQQEQAQGKDEGARAYAAKYLPPILNHTALIYGIAGMVKAPGSAERMTALRASMADMNAMMSGVGSMNMSGMDTTTGTSSSSGGSNGTGGAGGSSTSGGGTGGSGTGGGTSGGGSTGSGTN